MEEFREFEAFHSTSLCSPVEQNCLDILPGYAALYQNEGTSRDDWERTAAVFAPQSVQSLPHTFSTASARFFFMDHAFIRTSSTRTSIAALLRFWSLNEWACLVKSELLSNSSRCSFNGSLISPCVLQRDEALPACCSLALPGCPLCCFCIELKKSKRMIRSLADLFSVSRIWGSNP